MSRSPVGRSLRKKLRKEVGFGCPVDGCRIPFLEYHHFDPPYSEGKQHSESGMIALCPIHHRQADQNAWSIKDLHEMKNIKRRDHPKGRLGWSIDEGVVIAGGNYFFTSTLTMRINGKELFRLEQDNKTKILVNALLWNKNKDTVVEIKNNDMLINHALLEDMDCMASGKEIYFKVPDNSNKIKVKFDRESSADILEEADKNLDSDISEYFKIELNKRILNGIVNTVRVEAVVQENDFDFEIGVNKIIMDFRRVGLDRAEYYGRVHLINSALSLSNDFTKQELIYLGR